MPSNTGNVNYMCPGFRCLEYAAIDFISTSTCFLNCEWVQVGREQVLMTLIYLSKLDHHKLIQCLVTCLTSSRYPNFNDNPSTILPLGQNVRDIWTTRPIFFWINGNVVWNISTILLMHQWVKRSAAQHLSGIIQSGKKASSIMNKIMTTKKWRPKACDHIPLLCKICKMHLAYFVPLALSKCQKEWRHSKWGQYYSKPYWMV